MEKILENFRYKYQSVNNILRIYCSIIRYSDSPVNRMFNYAVKPVCRVSIIQI